MTPPFSPAGETPHDPPLPVLVGARRETMPPVHRADLRRTAQDALQQSGIMCACMLVFFFLYWMQRLVPKGFPGHAITLPLVAVAAMAMIITPYVLTFRYGCHSEDWQHGLLFGTILLMVFFMMGFLINTVMAGVGLIPSGKSNNSRAMNSLGALMMPLLGAFGGWTGRREENSRREAAPFV